MSSQADLLFGKLAVMNKFVTQTQVDECVALQDRYQADGISMTLGEILQKKGYLKPTQIPAITRAQQYMAMRSEDIRFGQIAISNKFLTQDQIAAALECQAQDFKGGKRVQRIGKVLLDNGTLTTQQVNAVLKAQERLKASTPGTEAAKATTVAPPASTSTQSRTQTRFGATPPAADPQPAPPATLPKSPPPRRTPEDRVATREAPAVSPPEATRIAAAHPPSKPAAVPPTAVVPAVTSKKTTRDLPAVARTPTAVRTPSAPPPEATMPTTRVPIPPSAPVSEKKKTNILPSPTAASAIPEAPVAPPRKATVHLPAETPVAPVAPAANKTARPTEFRVLTPKTGTPAASAAPTPAPVKKSSRPTEFRPLGAKDAPTTVPATPPSKGARPTTSLPSPGKSPTGAFAARTPAAVPKRPTAAVPKPDASAAPAEGGDVMTIKLANCQVTLKMASVTNRNGQLWGIHIVTLHGNLDGKTFPHVEEFMNNLMDQGHFRFVLNCSAMDYLSSAGVGVLISVARRAREVQGDIMLSQVPKKVQGIINVLGLGSYLTSYPGDDEAVAAYAQA